MTSVKCQSLKHKTSAFQPLKIINSAFSAFPNVESAVCLKDLLVASWAYSFCICIPFLWDHLEQKQSSGVMSCLSEILKDLDDYYEKFKRETDAVQKRRMLHCIQRALIRSQELGDEKIQIVSQMVELVENRTRQVDSHVELFETCQETNDTTGNSGKASQDKSKNETIAQAEKPNNKRSRRQRNNENRENASNNHDHDDITSGTPKEKKAKTSKKKKRSKAKAEREASPPDLPIDPNEPTYCLCNQVSYGEMIGCDNDECPIEWFHFSCVGLNHKPKGKWYCPKCRGENEKTMDKALEKSKKERAYNR
ncbi:inhibitor of growth protein 1 isoform X1 [Camarhynchus parvulus]|nr:inhibitor of growth protein 1 isoform X1 [Camarhynchus parvulus]